MVKSLYFEDFTPGQTLAGGAYTVSKEEAVAFAGAYDPQYFHLDEAAARKSFFGRLAVSGWHTAAIAMRLKTQSDLGKMAGGLIGMGLESVKWPQAVYPGDTLRLAITILDSRLSASRPDYGILRYKAEAFNQQDARVLEMVTAVLAPRRAN